MAETIRVIQENIQNDASSINKATDYFDKRELPHIDNRTTISANQKGKDAYNESQSLIYLLGINLNRQIENIRSLGLEFEQVDINLSKKLMRLDKFKLYEEKFMKRDEEEIKKEIKNLEDQSEQIDYIARQYERDEQFQEERMESSLAELDRMLACCSESDYELREVIDRKRQLVRTIQKENIDIVDEVKMWIAKEREKIEAEHNKLYNENKTIYEEKRKRGGNKK